MKQTISTLCFVLLFGIVAVTIWMSARATIQFASQLSRPTPVPGLRARPTPVAKPTPVATGALSGRAARLPS